MNAHNGRAPAPRVVMSRRRRSALLAPAAASLLAAALAFWPQPAMARPGCPPGMKLVDAGRFVQGDGETASVRAFCLDVTEVTVAAYAECVAGGTCRDDRLACGKAASYGEPRKKDHPVNCVSWHEADAYCRDLGKRLPAEQEWEWAARGQRRGSTYPWGEAPPAQRACWDGDDNGVNRGERQGTCPVKSHRGGDAPGGFADLAGNVREWTASEDGDGKTRVVRGGSWGDSLPSFLSASFRGMNLPVERFELTGFRCASAPGSEGIVKKRLAARASRRRARAQAEASAGPFDVFRIRVWQ